MDLFNVFVVIGIILILLVFAGWYTTKKFNKIEEDETGRRKHIEEDMKVDDTS